jgi:uncharacterized protein
MKVRRIVSGRETFGQVPGALDNYVKATFAKAFSTANPKPEILELTRRIANLVGAQALNKALADVSYNRTNTSFFIHPKPYFNADGRNYEQRLRPLVDQIDTSNLDAFGQLILRANVQLCRDLLIQS